MTDTSKKPREKLDELISEFGRGNYHHVNDTDERKVMSFDDCQETYKYLSSYQSLKEQAEKLREALEYVVKNSRTSTDYNLKARQALENYRKWKGDL